MLGLRIVTFRCTRGQLATNAVLRKIFLFLEQEATLLLFQIKITKGLPPLIHTFHAVYGIKLLRRGHLVLMVVKVLGHLLRGQQGCVQLLGDGRLIHVCPDEHQLLHHRTGSKSAQASDDNITGS